MNDITNFESRTGKVNCNAEGLFNFVTDLRNFERLLPHDSISDLKIEKDSASFRVSMLGTVTLHISEEIEFSKVIFLGNAMQINDFFLVLDINDRSNPGTEFRILLSAELNPFLKMIAAEPVRQLLETLVKEMEKFRGWQDVK